MQQRLCFGLVLAILLHSSSFFTTATKIRLIHRHSLLSSFHKEKLSRNPDDDIRGALSPEKHQSLFLVNVSIGTPPVPQLLAMDTGSSLVWVCIRCGTDLGPEFDPNKSSSYKTVSCASTSQCVDYYNLADCRMSQCYYKISYYDGSYSSGVISTDKFTFEASSESLVELPDMPFGSGLYSELKVVQFIGIFGLKPSGAHSLLSVVGNKFSYCLGNISDPSYMHNALILGNGARFEGPSTPIRKVDSLYLVNLERISIGGVQLPIDQKEFGFNSVIDSGSTATILTRGLLDPLKEVIKKLLDGVLQRVEIIDTDYLCYSGNMVRDLKGFPTVTLHFAGGADLDLNADAVFQRLTPYNVFCLAMDASADGINVIGVYAQQYYNLGFDMNAMTVSMQYIDCSLLDE